MLARRRAVANPGKSFVARRSPILPGGRLLGENWAPINGQTTFGDLRGSMRKGTRLAMFLAAVLPALALAEAGRAEGIREEALTIPAVLSESGGSQTVELEA